MSVVITLVLGLSASCGPQNQRPGAELRAAAPPPVASPAASPAPAPSSPTPAPQCPEPPAVVARMHEGARPAWSTGLSAVRCPQEACLGYESCVCDERGRMLSRTSHAREHVIFDEQGRPSESLFDNSETGRRAHLVYFYGSGCTVEGYDLDDDTLLDRVCRRPERCVRGAPCQECGPVQMVLRSTPCRSGACPATASRCGCDAQGRVIETVNDQGHYRQLTTYDSAGRITDVSSFRGDTLIAQQQTVFDGSGRVIERRDLASGPITTSTTTRTEWKADGSRREIVKVGDLLVSDTYHDLSKPGQETVTIKTQQGTTTRTTLLRQDHGQPLRIELPPPLTERWLTCQSSKDCTVVIDHCQCDAAYFVSRRYEQALRDHIARECRKHGIVACPAVVRPMPGPPRCVQNLCVH